MIRHTKSYTPYPNKQIDTINDNDSVTDSVNDIVNIPSDVKFDKVEPVDDDIPPANPVGPSGVLSMEGRPPELLQRRTSEVSFSPFDLNTRTMVIDSLKGNFSILKMLHQSQTDVCIKLDTLLSMINELVVSVNSLDSRVKKMETSVEMTCSSSQSFPGGPPGVLSMEGRPPVRSSSPKGLAQLSSERVPLSARSVGQSRPIAQRVPLVPGSRPRELKK